MDNKARILWITRTAVFVALLVGLQALTKPLGQYVTGSVVNLVLIMSVMLGGLWSGVTVAVLSPLFAFLLGIGPAMFPLTPFIMLGNLALVLVWHFVAGNAPDDKLLSRGIVALVGGAVVKFAVLYLGIVMVAVPFILKLPAPQAAAISAAFSFPQLITAGIGGAVALVILPVLRKAVKKPA